MAKAEKKAAPAKAPVKRARAKQPVEIVPAPVVVQPPFYLKWWTVAVRYKYYAIGAIVLLIFFILLLTRRNPSKIVSDNDKATGGYQAQIERLQAERDSLRNAATDDSLALVNAIHYADAAHNENVRMEEENRRIAAQLSAYLQQQKIKSDANKQIIKNGSARDLDSLWERLKLTKGFKQ